MTSEDSLAAQTAPGNEDLDSPRFARVQGKLLHWFGGNRRDLPWRRSRDPYQILVSEVMLQQTQVDRVLPYYRAFLDRFPTAAALAAAPTADVIRTWSGLGYNRRAVNLQRTARYVVDEEDGVFPRDVDALRRLPGIGPYTAGAIACFAFEQDVAFIDTNMRRVLHRLFVGVDVPAPQVPDRTVIAIAERALPPGLGWDWNQGLIEFGALHCTSRKPACVVCPLQPECRAFPAIQGVLAAARATPRPRREPAFAGSNRFYRGRIIAALRDLPGGVQSSGIDLRSLGPLVRPDFRDEHVPWLSSVIDGLARDGLARIAEECPPYDAGTGEGGGSARVKVRLP